MILHELLNGISVKKIEGESESEIKNICSDSRKAHEDSLFTAIRGSKVDGHSFIDVVPAKAIVCEELPLQLKKETTYIVVENSQIAWAMLSANYFGRPASVLKVVGVTGTNGKSSVVTLLFDLFTSLGFKVGLISTIRYKIGNREIPATHTTPDAYRIHELFRQMVDEECTHCFMEVSSHALSQHRTHGIPFRMAIFTNISHDHLDYHGDFKSYIYAKKLLFDHLTKGSIALVNKDDRNAKVMVQNSIADMKTFSIRQIADYRAKILENTLEGLRLALDGVDVWFRLLGEFNAYNLLAVYGVAREEGVSKSEILANLSLLTGAEGRMQVIRANHREIVGIVDYSHTPDSLENALSTIASFNVNQGKIITVVGCGGDRDMAKRPKMGKIGADFSDYLILTSDNPRSENPVSIIDEMYEGIDSLSKANVFRMADRKEAIRLASIIAREGDVILIAGKGHETYQEIDGKKYPFDDREILLEALNS